MFKFLVSSSIPKQENGLEGFDMQKALRRIPAKDLAIMTFQRLDEHMKNCAENSASTLTVLKYVGWIVGALALEKLNEIFHVVQHLPTIPGG